MNTATNTFKRNAYAYLIDCINDDECETMTPAEKVRYMEGRIRSELAYVVKRQGFHTACVDFLQGLGMGIDYMNGDIIQAAAKMHEQPANAWDEKRQSRMVDGWFPFMAYKMEQMFRHVNGGDTFLLPTDPATK